MKLILTGATGFAGGEVLKQALADPAIERVTVLTRRTVGVTHAKLGEVIMQDFLDYSAVRLEADACIWCLGVSQTQVDKDKYVVITYEYPVAAAAAMIAANPRLRFCFVSGRGADPSEQSSTLFARIKGRAERVLGEKHPQNLVVFRPGYIKPTKQSGPRKDFARFAAPIGTLMGLFIRDFSVDCDQLARCLLGVAKNGSDTRLFDNRAIVVWPAWTPR
ncbi:MAG TPA: NAD-dependent epimerase/dehydratase family protein [Steroidobacteraceae bacterium]|nr:NAD-dependent epimerase/dehydratase family protein [Steroidobacteraceae bacterium]